MPGEDFTDIGARTNNIRVNKDVIKEYIINNIISPYNIRTLSELLSNRNFWRRMGNYVEAIAVLLIVVSTVFSFAAGVYDQEDFSFVAGLTNTIGLSLKGFIVYAYRESKERTRQANRLLTHYGIEELPIIISDGSSDKSKTHVEYNKRTKRLEAFTAGDEIDVMRGDITDELLSKRDKMTARIIDEVEKERVPTRDNVSRFMETKDL